MKCPELVLDKRNNKVRICGAEIYGITGLQEIMAERKHFKRKHTRQIEMEEALNIRAESGQ